MNPQSPNETATQPQTDPSVPQGPAPAPQIAPAPVAMQQPVQVSAPKSKRRWLLVVAALVIVVVVVLGGLAYLGKQVNKEEGAKKAQDFVALLESGDSDAAINQIAAMMGVDPNASDTSDPQVQKALGAITQAAQISRLLQTTDAKLDSSTVAKLGEYDPRQVDAVVVSNFSITIDSGSTGHYTVKTAKKDGAWKLYSLEWSAE